MKKPVFRLLACVLIILFIATLADAAVPNYINYQGIVTNENGDPIRTAVDIVFTIYNAAVMGDVLWTEVRNLTPDTDGRFTVVLGQAVPIADSVFKSPPCWLGVKVGMDTELTPRTLLSSVPYTHRVSTIDGATGGNVIGPVTVLTDGLGDGAGVRDPGGNIGITTPLATTFTDSTGEHSASYGIDGITMTGDNTTLKDVLLDTLFHVGLADTTISFGTLSKATGQGAIALGDSAIVAGNYSTIAGGEKNEIVESFGFIGGGSRNIIEDLDGEVETYGVIGGGREDTVRGICATVPGGRQNVARGNYSFAAGHGARAIHDGSFVWSDDAVPVGINSDHPNQFKIKAANGMSLASDAGDAKAIAVGEYFRDNAIVAWGDVTSSGSILGDFGITSVAHTGGSGTYRITIDAVPASANSIVPTVTLELDAIPTSAATARLAYVNIISATIFDVYVTNGSHTATDNQFVFIVTAR